MMNKLFAAAKISGEMVQCAAQKAIEDANLDADRSYLLNANKRQLQSELAHTYKSLVEITNKGDSYPVKEHDYLVGRKQFIEFLMNPTRKQCASLQWMWGTN